MTHQHSNYQLMSVTACTDENGNPMLDFCNQFMVPITSYAFVLTMVNAIKNKFYFALALRSHKKLTISVIQDENFTSLGDIHTEPKDVIVKIFFDGLFMGYTDLEQLYIALEQIKTIITELKSGGKE